MKVKLLVNKGDIKRGEIFEARVIPFMLGSAYQCIEGRLMGVLFQPNDVIELDELPISQEEIVQLKQENLQRLEEVQGLQHKVQSLTVYNDKKVEKVRRLSEDLSKAWAACSAEREARMLLEATLERAMLDQQPVVLPKEVAEAVAYYEGQNFTPSSFAKLFFRSVSDSSDNEHTKVLKRFTDDGSLNGDKLLRALVNGYTVEDDQTTEEKLKQGIKGVYVDWTNLPEADDKNLEKEADFLSELITDYVKEFYSKH